MKIEKGQTFVLSQKPYVVGIVWSIKDSKQERYVIKTTEGEEFGWNNKSQKFSDDVDYTALSEDTLLVEAETDEECECESCDCCEEDSELGLESGDVWSTDNEEAYLIVELDKPAILFGKEYKFRGLSLSSDVVANPVAYFNEAGTDSLNMIQLTEYTDSADHLF
jgi:hypothetical protein